jgi:hypothetical protein
LDTNAAGNCPPNDKGLTKAAARRLRNRRLGLGAVSKSDAAMISGEGVLAADGFGEPGHTLATWLADKFNHNFDNYDRAIDEVYNATRVGGSQYHHLIDGQHSIWGAFKAVPDVAADDTWLTEMTQAAEHLVRDTASVSGINPFFSLSPEMFDRLGSVVSQAGISKAFLVDALTINGPELLGGAIAVLSAVTMGRQPDPERLSRLAGGCLLSATVSPNPVLLPVATAGIAFAAINAEDRKDVFVHAGKGGLVSGSALLVSSLVGGPIWLGCAAGILAGIAVSKAMDNPEAAFARAQKVVRPAAQVLQSVSSKLQDPRDNV